MRQAVLRKLVFAAFAAMISLVQTLPASAGDPVTTYEFVFRNFSGGQLEEITTIMETEFPKHIKSRIVSSDSVQTSYMYISRAPTHKIEEWMTILLTDMGFPPGRQVELTVRGSSVRVAKAPGVLSTRANVVVMSDDSDPSSIPRSNPIAQRAILQLKERLGSLGLAVIDEEFLAMSMGWQIRQRHPVADIVQTMQSHNKKGEAEQRLRFLVLAKIMATVKNMSFMQQARVLMSADVFDVDEGKLVSSWEEPGKTFPMPTGCSGMCITEVLGGEARKIAKDVGDALSRKLETLMRN